MNFNYCGLCGNPIRNDRCVSCGVSVAVMLKGLTDDHLTLFDVATVPMLAGWQFSLRHMMLDRIAYHSPAERDAWVGAMVRWADSKHGTIFIVPEMSDFGANLGKRTEILSGYGSKCPTCGESATSVCRCMLGDTRCRNGHNWHECRVHGLVAVGAKHDGGKSDCTCQVGE